MGMSSTDNAVLKHCCCSELYQSKSMVSAGAHFVLFESTMCLFFYNSEHKQSNSNVHILEKTPIFFQF